jgi:hypothetical protein
MGPVSRVVLEMIGEFGQRAMPAGRDWERVLAQGERRTIWMKVYREAMEHSRTR